MQLPPETTSVLVNITEAYASAAIAGFRMRGWMSWAYLSTSLSSGPRFLG